MIVRELLTRLGFETKQGERAAKRFDKVVGGLRRRLLRLAQVAVATFSGIALIRMTSGMAKIGDQAAKLGETVGLTAEQIQGLHFASRRLGISTQLTNSAIRAFARRIGAADRDMGPAINAVEQMNLQIRDANDNMRPLIDLFFEVSNHIASMGSEAEQIQLADMFFSETGRPLTLLLKEGEQGIRRYMNRQRELGGLIDNFTAGTAEKFMDIMTDFRTAMQGLRFAVGIELMPRMTALIERFLDWFIINQKIIRQNIGDFVRGLIFILRAFGLALTRMARGVNTVAEAMGGWERTLRLLTAALLAFPLVRLVRWIGRRLPAAIRLLTSFRGALALLLLAARAIIRRLPFVAIVLALEDFIAWMTGAESQLGKFINTLRNWRDKVVEFLGDVRDAIKNWLEDTMIGRFFSRIGSAISSLSEGFSGTSGALGAPPRVGPFGGSLRDININERVEVNVPPGTPEEQAQEIHRQVRRQIQQQFEYNIRTAINEEPAFDG